MTQPTMTLLYVNELPRSVKFYEGILKSTPLEQAPDFAMFKMNEGTMLGLWTRHDVKPAPKSQAGATEIGFHAPNEEALRAKLAEWQGQGVSIVQEPVRLNFGLTFTAQDPDGHRLRVFM